MKIHQEIWGIMMKSDEGVFCERELEWEISHIPLLYPTEKDAQQRINYQYKIQGFSVYKNSTPIKLFICSDG